MNNRIVVTNDDGVDAPGILALARALEQAGYQVTVIAPDHDASGTGTSLGAYSPSNPIRYRRTSLDGLKGAAYAVAGPPALCSLLAANEAFGKVPDLVASGINAGMNTGRSVVHSGTVGGALAAQNFGMRGMAVSVGGGDTWQWETAAAIAVKVLPAVLKGPERSVANVNVPGVPLDEIKGIRWSNLAKFGTVKASVKSVTDSHVHLENMRTDYAPEWATDLAATRSGMVAVTCLQGVSEVWSSEIEPEDWFDPSQRICGSMAGDRVTPPLLYL